MGFRSVPVGCWVFRQVSRVEIGGQLPGWFLGCDLGVIGSIRVSIFHCRVDCDYLVSLIGSGGLLEHY